MAQEKIALITSGGGMKCAYGGGALAALGKNVGIAAPDIAVAASGSVGPMFYYLAKQYEAGAKVWITYASSPLFVRYFPFPRLNIDYLIDTVCKQYVPLDTEALGKTATRYFVPVTDEDTALTEYVSNTTWFDPYEIMRAAKAIPLLYHRHIFLGPRHYMDGGIGVSTQDLIDKAVAEGATRILLISNLDKKPGYMKDVFTAYSYWQREPLEDALLKYNNRVEHISFPPGIRGVHISPSEPLPIGLITRNRRKVAEAFYMGYDDVVARRDEILDLFKP